MFIRRRTKNGNIKIIINIVKRITLDEFIGVKILTSLGIKLIKQKI